MKVCHLREIINPFFPCEMEGYSEERFLMNQTIAAAELRILLNYCHGDCSSD